MSQNTIIVKGIYSGKHNGKIQTRGNQGEEKSPAKKIDIQWESLKIWGQIYILTLCSTAWYLLSEQNE